MLPVEALVKSTASRVGARISTSSGRNATVLARHGQRERHPVTATYRSTPHLDTVRHCSAAPTQESVTVAPETSRWVGSGIASTCTMMGAAGKHGPHRRTPLGWQAMAKARGRDAAAHLAL